jgi:MraZ protein
MKQLDYFERKLDDKNRLTIPAEIRAELGREVVVTPGFKNYLHLYSKKVWEEKMEPALHGDILDEHLADLNVKFRKGKTEASLDAKQGRIILEQHLLKYAGIRKQIVAVRAGSYWRLTPKEKAV